MRSSARSRWSRAPSAARPSRPSRPVRPSSSVARSCVASLGSTRRSTRCSCVSSPSTWGFSRSASSRRHTVDAETRVARRVLELGRVYGGAPPVVIPLIQEDLAALAGTSRATVNRVLRDARTRGLVELGRDAPSSDPDGLARLGCGTRRSCPRATRSTVPRQTSRRSWASVWGPRRRTRAGSRPGSRAPSTGGRSRPSRRSAPPAAILGRCHGSQPPADDRPLACTRERSSPARASLAGAREPRFEATQWNGPVLTLDDGRAAQLGPTCSRTG